MRTMNASEFKAKCLAVLDEVASSGEPITILKRGRAVAQLVRPATTGTEYAQHTLRGTATIHDDIVEPALPADEWEALARSRS